MPFVATSVAARSFDTPERLLSPTGADLALRIQPALDETKAIGIIQICHGLAEHSARYADFARFLSKNGFHVCAHDHRGHGLTTAEDAPQGQFARIDGAKKVLRDVAFVEQTMRRRFPDLPLILFGHSMGGLITLASLCTRQTCPDAAAICNSNFADPRTQKLARFLLKAERMFLGSDVPSHLLPQMTFRAWAKQIPNRQSEFDWLSHDAAEVALYNADPYCGFAPSISMWLDIWCFMQLCNDPAPRKYVPLTLPIMLQGGGQDPSNEGGKAITTLSERLAKTGFSHLTTKTYPEMRHESLHELTKAKFMQDFLDWAHAAITIKS